MNIGIEHHNDKFNVTLTSPGGSEPFLTVKGCRIFQGQNGPFVSWPATKLDQRNRPGETGSGKYLNHFYASRAFGDAVLSAYNKSKAAAPAPRPASRARPADDDVPF